MLFQFGSIRWITYNLTITSGLTAPITCHLDLEYFSLCTRRAVELKHKKVNSIYTHTSTECIIIMPSVAICGKLVNFLIKLNWLIFLRCQCERTSVCKCMWKLSSQTNDRKSTQIRFIGRHKKSKSKIRNWCNWKWNIERKIQRMEKKDVWVSIISLISMIDFLPLHHRIHFVCLSWCLSNGIDNRKSTTLQQLYFVQAIEPISFFLLFISDSKRFCFRKTTMNIKYDNGCVCLEFVICIPQTPIRMEVTPKRIIDLNGGGNISGH